MGFISAFVRTFVNLDIHHLISFRGDIASWDFTMPFIGGFLSTLLFPKIREKFVLKNALRVSFIALFIVLGLMIFLINTFFDFPLRFLIGFFAGFLLLELACFQAELFQAPYRATFFGFMGILVVLSRSIGSSCVDYFHRPFEVFTICMGGLVICYFLVFMWQEPLERKKLRTVKSSKDSGKDSRRNSGKAFYQIIALSPLIFISVFMMGSIGGGISSYLPIFFENLGLSEGDAALAYSFSGLGALVFLPIAGRIGDKWGYEKAFLLITFMGLFSVIMSFFFTQIDALSASFFVIRASKGAFLNLMYAWVATQFAGKNLAYGMSSFSLIKSISYIFAPLGVGTLIGFYGDTGLLLWILGGLSVTFVLMIFEIKKIKSP
ncbi:MAG TPA: MFS transporter [Alphaproteobacteria bacterium]|nr:MFS transporter [Alphaproteobacteria bacterium]